MYKETLKLTLNMYKIVLAFVAVGIIITVLGEREILDSSGDVTSSILFIVLAFYAHFLVLFPGRIQQKEDNNKLIGFLGWSFLLFFLIAILAALISLPFIGYAVSTNADAESGSFGLFILAFVVVYGIVSLFFYSLFGTVLPAHVAGREKGLKKAFKRGKKNFFYIFGRLLIGPGLIITLSTLVYFALLGATINSDTLFRDGWVPNIAAIIAEAAFWWINCWATIMVAWVLSKAFMRTDTVDVAAPMKEKMTSS